MWKKIIAPCINGCSSVGWRADADAVFGWACICAWRKTVWLLRSAHFTHQLHSLFLVLQINSVYYKLQIGAIISIQIEWNLVKNRWFESKSKWICWSNEMRTLKIQNDWFSYRFIYDENLEVMKFCSTVKFMLNALFHPLCLLQPPKKRPTANNHPFFTIFWWHCTDLSRENSNNFWVVEFFAAPKIPNSTENFETTNEKFKILKIVYHIIFNSFF